MTNFERLSIANDRTILEALAIILDDSYYREGVPGMRLKVLDAWARTEEFLHEEWNQYK